MQPPKVSPSSSASIEQRGVSGRTMPLVIGAIILAVVSAVTGYVIAIQSSPATERPASSAEAQSELGQRQATVTANGAHVMPFDLSKTTHTFTDVPMGGIEAITANDLQDSSQSNLIRMHLQHEADNFSKGDFSDPAATHGKDMPGLAVLEKSAGRLNVKYSEVDGGAQLIYSSTDPALVTALHQWFEAQRTDHNTHGEMEMNMDVSPTPRIP